MDKTTSLATSLRVTNKRLSNNQNPEHMVFRVDTRPTVDRRRRRLNPT
jgi:hypothetical protein